MNEPTSEEWDGAGSSEDAAAFAEILRRFRSASASSVTPQPVADAAGLVDGDVHELPAADTDKYRECMALGQQAFSRGEVALVLAAGGAATRFGGGVKALVPVFGGRTFLDFKLLDVREAGRQFGRPVPVAVMTSALTDRGIRSHLREQAHDDVIIFQQRMLPRLTPSLQLAHDHAGNLSMAPSGHGDFFRAIRATAGRRLEAQGVRLLYFSNVDNLAATLSPLVIGMHLRLGAKMTVELTPRRNPTSGTLDGGAAPVRIGGRVRLVEEVDGAAHPFISTNNITFTLRTLLDVHPPLPYHLVRRNFEGNPVLQCEQITAEVTGLDGPDGTALIPLGLVHVPREGPSVSRFEPVKTPEDLTRVVARLGPRWAEAL